MTTLDDKLLGEKLHYYCSSSEDEAEEESPKEMPPSSQGLNEWDGFSTNTGPKGVIKDWQRYKQLETEKREEQEQEKLALFKKLSLTCQSVKDEEKLRQQEEELDKELAELFDDNILEEFKILHMQQLMNQHSNQSKYGQVYDINTGQEYLDAIDKTDKSTSVVMYIYSDREKFSKIIYESVQSLASDYPEVKFCCVEVSVAGLSRHFERKGVPALLVYKGGILTGNFVRITDDLGDGFVTSDLENYLLEHGMLPDKSLIFTSLRKKAELDSD